MGCGVQVRVGEYNIWAFTAQFKRQSFECVSGITRDDLCGAVFARERDLVDQRVLHASRSGCWAKSRDNVDHAIWNADFLCHLCHSQTGQRRLLSRFHHNGATGRECGAPFPSRHQDWKVPRDDLSGNPDGFALGIAKMVSANRNGFAMNFVSVTGVVSQTIDRQWQVRGRTFAERFAVVQRFQASQVFQFRLHPVGQFVHQPTAITSVHGSPRAFVKRMTSRFGRCVNVGSIAFGYLADFFFGCRVHGCESLATDRWPPLSINKTLGFSDLYVWLVGKGC